MKKTLVLIVLVLLYNNIFSQWQLSLTMKPSEVITDISSPNNLVIWAMTQNFYVYTTVDGGNNWQRIQCKGLASNISLLQLYVVNATTAFLSVNTNFTGVGPGIIYKTTNGGNNWKQVFSHAGNCEIEIGMFDAAKGLMYCSFNSFDGSVPAGETLYYTLTNGESWKVDTINPSKSTIQCLVTKNRQVAIADYTNFYFSPNRGFAYTTKDKLQHTSSPKYYLQVEDSNYAILNTDNNIDILVKRPATNGWIDMHQPPGVDNGFVTGIVLDGKECWMTEAFDNPKLFYSSDSAKTFTSTIPVPNAGFAYLIKARDGKWLIGATASPLSGKIYINKRLSINADKQTRQRQRIIQSIQ